jgi:hypothetical protein
MADEEQLIPTPPSKEDILFRDGLPDSWNNACVNVTWGDDQHGYTEGYRRGARLLVEYVTEQQRDQDYLVYPIIFLYRHHIELALKNLIRQAPYVIDRPLSMTETQHLDRHRLDLLWQDFKPMFADVCKAAGWGKLNAADEEGIDNYIRQFTALDQESFSFRYPRSKKGLPSLPSELRRINLRHFAELVERLADYLDALDTAVSVLVEQKAEMEADWRRQEAACYDGDYA